MKKTITCLLTLTLSAVCLMAQTATTEEVEALKQQLRQATDSFEKAMKENRAIIERLQQQVEKLEQRQAPPAQAESPVTIPAGEAEHDHEEAGHMHEEAGLDGHDHGAAVKLDEHWNPSGRMTLLENGSSYLDLSFEGLFAAGSSTATDIEESLELGAHDPNQRGFTLQNLEATFAGAVDRYFTGQANIIFQVDSEGESTLEIEEAFMQTSSLPGNLQVKAGQYFTEFGRQNTLHPHAWDFVDLPLANGRFLGPDGTRNPGARISWQPPARFYNELFFSMQNSQGETAASFRTQIETESEKAPYAFRKADNDRGVHALEDMLYGPRYVLGFEPAEGHFLKLGGSALFGPNASGDEDAGNTDSQVYGLDILWKWTLDDRDGFVPFISWNAEGMLRRYGAGAFDWDLNGNGAADADEIVDPATGLPAVLSGERLTDHGFYTQILYGYRQGWVAGLRFDYVTGNHGSYEGRGYTLDGEALGRDQARATRWRLSPNLTWYPTDYSRFRLQYNYDDRNGLGDDHSVWMQFSFRLGAHGAHDEHEEHSH